MKKLPIILLSVFCLQFIISSCDSPSGSKPEVVTKPTLVAPNDNATNVGLTPVFQWTGSADKLEIASNTNFSTPDHAANISGQQYQMPNGVLVKNHEYFWRVGKTSGQSIDWSTSIFRFRTIP